MALMVPFIILGVWAGRWLALRVDRVTYERVILGLLSISGVLLLVLRVGGGR
jgi:hypothetical protein